MKKTVLAIISMIIPFVSGCAPHMNLVIGGDDFPQTPQKYIDDVKSSSFIHTNKRVVNLALNKMVPKLKSIGKKCYHVEVSTRRRERGLFSFGSTELYRQELNPKVTTSKAGGALFTMQIKGLKGSKTIGAKEPEDGMWLYGIEFKPTGKKQTTAMVYSPTGWGSAAGSIIDAVEGKYGKECPPMSDIHPGAS
jgi:hypothetical protein